MTDSSLATTASPPSYTAAPQCENAHLPPYSGSTGDDEDVRKPQPAYIMDSRSTNSNVKPQASDDSIAPPAYIRPSSGVALFSTGSRNRGDPRRTIVVALILILIFGVGGIIYVARRGDSNDSQYLHLSGSDQVESWTTP
ncbi:hypothetical protein LTR37_008189 [Vermiconidia calcicola]|uniref:Uncharacterized protein n=1 Tax=Vermiconidia calcicola TaxID=1690605 RepID=A0ACC3NBH6_9PEZI|nr:hypothetical protein LTR37_008189 [Vermiconidia calcicola]